MTDPAVLRQMIDDLRDHVNDRLHEHGKQISRQEGLFEERTRNLQRADERNEQAITAVGAKVDNLSTRFTDQLEQAKKDLGHQLESATDDLRKQLTASTHDLGKQIGTMGQTVTESKVKLAIYAAIAVFLLTLAATVLANAFGVGG